MQPRPVGARPGASAEPRGRRLGSSRRRPPAASPSPSARGLTAWVPTPALVPTSVQQPTSPPAPASAGSPSHPHPPLPKQPLPGPSRDPGAQTLGPGHVLPRAATPPPRGLGFAAPPGDWELKLRERRYSGSWDSAGRRTSEHQARAHRRRAQSPELWACGMLLL